MLLGKSSTYREIVARDKTEARLVLTGLHILMLMPIMMILTRVGTEILGGILVAVFLYRSYRLRDWEWCKKAPVIFAFMLWLYSVVVVTPLAMDVSLSLRRIDWARFIILFAAIVYWLSAYHDEMRRIAAVILVALLIAATDGVYQFMYHVSWAGVPYIGERLTGPFSKTILGTFLTKWSIPCLGILLYYAWVEKKKWMLALLMLALLYIFSVILISGERTAVLTFALSMVLVAGGLFFYFKKLRLPILFFLVLIMHICVMAYSSQPTLQRRVYFTQELLQDFSNSTYAQVWKASLIMWREHPVTGVGMVNFRVACPKLLAEGKVSFCAEHSHNSYLEVLSEFGTAGLTLLILLVLSFIVTAIEQHESHPREKVLLTLFAFAGLLANFFPLAPTQSLFSNWPGFLAWQSVAWSLALQRGIRRHE